MALVASAGDVNGDGFADVVVGMPSYQGGSVKVYHGSAMGLSTSEDWSKTSSHSGAKFGWSVASAGDVDGDGYDDVIIGMPFYQGGNVKVFRGSATGLRGTADWDQTSSHTDAKFGHAVASAGDVDGDGYDDVIIGMPLYQGGNVKVFHGAATGLRGATAWEQTSSLTGAQFGHSVASAGDVDGDGYDDVIIGMPFYQGGNVKVFHGSATGLSGATAWDKTSTNTGAQFGHSVASAGDIDGDGFADVIIGMPFYQGGHVKVFHGSAEGLRGTTIWKKTSSNSSAKFGLSVAPAGDVNGDGYSDVIIGAPEDDGSQTDEGKAYVYYGGNSAPTASNVSISGSLVAGTAVSGTYK